jgi:hypothetical protein
MLLFQLEEDIDKWCVQTGRSRGEVMPLEQVWRLSQRWYHNRLSPDYRGRTAAQVEAIFEEVGLIGGFWKFNRD